MSLAVEIRCLATVWYTCTLLILVRGEAFGCTLHTASGRGERWERPVLD